jgi:hypothetical protein
MAVKLVVTFAIVFVATTAFAQAIPPAASPTPSAAPAAGSPSTVVIGRSLTFEWIIVFVMAGLAVFSVCRSSRRN